MGLAPYWLLRVSERHRSSQPRDSMVSDHPGGLMSTLSFFLQPWVD